MDAPQHPKRVYTALEQADARRVYPAWMQEQLMLRMNWLLESLFESINANTPRSREEAEMIVSALVEEIPKILPL